MAPICCAIRSNTIPSCRSGRCWSYLRSHEMFLTAYSPIARGEAAKHPTLVRIGEAHGKSAVQVTLRWLLDQTNVVAIPKASGEKHLKSNFEIFDFTAERRGAGGDRRPARQSPPDQPRLGSGLGRCVI